MCLAVPGEIVKLEAPYAMIQLLGVRTKVYIELIEEPKVGEHVLIHAGCAIEKINNEYFNYLEELYQNLLDRNEWTNE